jgi:hypothetical protein
VRVNPPAGDEQRSEDTDEERNDGEKYEAEDIPTIPRGIRRRRGEEFSGLGVTGG